jgi:hypothetical protein
MTTTTNYTDSKNCTDDQKKPVIAMHPEFKCKREDDILVDDCLDGQRKIKSKGTDYLPQTSAQKEDDKSGSAYDAYKERAIYYNYPMDTLEAASGMMQKEPAVFTLPSAMESLETSATIDNDPLSGVLADINENQIAYGRYGLLNDMPQTTDRNAIPYIVKYAGKTIINWHEDIKEGKKRKRMVVLDESHYKMGKGGNHEYVNMYRVCALDEKDKYWTKSFTPEEYSKIDFETFNPPEDGNNYYPHYKGKNLDYVPFTFINVSNLSATPQKSPILDVCNLSIAIYRKEADHSQAEFVQGQSTPYAVGLTSEEEDDINYLGATSLITASNPDAKLGYMEVSGDGLEETANTIENLKNTVVSKSVAIMDKSMAESGKTVSIRASASTSVLKTIAVTGAEGLTSSLDMIYNWITSGKSSDLRSLDEKELSVTPNMDFIDDDLSSVADDIFKLVQSKNMGAPLSNKSIHQFAAKKEVTAMTYEEEQEEIKTEGPVIPPVSEVNLDNA